MASNPDAAKVAAFNNFNWDDERFKAHLNAIELPSDAAAQLLKVKARWYKRIVDPSFEVEWATSPAPKPTATAGQTTGSAANQRPAAPKPPPAARASAAPPVAGAARGTHTAGKGLTKSDELMLLAAHITTVMLAVFHLLPVLTPLGLSSKACYLWALRLTMFAQGYKINAKSGLPPVWPFSWDKIKAWLQQVLPSTEFFHVMVSFSFSSQAPISLLLYPICVPAAYHAITHLARQWSSLPQWAATGGRLHALMLGKQREATLSCATAEVIIGFILLARLIAPSRNILLTFFYWNMLKMRYMQSDMQAFHHEVWTTLDRMTIKYRAMVPIVETAIGYVKRWFLAVQ